MTQPIIQVEHVSKKYCRRLSSSLWYGVKDIAAQLWASSNQWAELRPDEFWALRDVSLTLNPGESMGVVGHNGAGKSTLLKMLIGRLMPTRGRIVTRGKVVAITELGLGFNPVLTGRENIFVNAAILGLSRREAALLLDEIIAFADLGEFIDSPVQTYSTGMRARLGYSVAAHMNPDVLLVDEVLAVGDISFRRKCAQHIKRYLDNGGSLLLVSHDPYTVQSMCQRCLVLDHGQVVFDGTSVEGVNVLYELGYEKKHNEALRRTQHAPHNRSAASAGSGSISDKSLAVQADTLGPRTPASLLQEDAYGEDEGDCRFDMATHEALAGSPCRSQVAGEGTTSRSEGYLTNGCRSAEAGDDGAQPVETLDPCAVPDLDERSENAAEATPIVESARPTPDSETRLEPTAEYPVIIDGIDVLPLQNEELRTGEPVRVAIRYRSFEDIDAVLCGFDICTVDMMLSITGGVAGFDDAPLPIQRGSGRLCCVIPDFPLRPGTYAIRGGIADAATGSPIALRGYEDAPCFFTVTAAPSRTSNTIAIMGGLVSTIVKWER